MAFNEVSVSDETLRALFAAAALTGMLASDMRRGFPKPGPGIVAIDAYEYAAAMLKEHNRETD